MSAIAEAAAAILAALRTVQGVRAYPDPSATIEAPATVLGPPALTWNAMCTGPTSGTWLVYVVVPADERALRRLWELVPLVAAVLDGVTDAAVIRADPGAYLSGGPELPCYEIQIEVSL